MDRGTLAGRRELALEEIEEKCGVDISRAALSKAPSTEIFQLFQLEKLASSMEPRDEKFLEEMLERISTIKGVGPSLYKRIEKALRE